MIKSKIYFAIALILCLSKGCDENTEEIPIQENFGIRNLFISPDCTPSSKKFAPGPFCVIAYAVNDSFLKVINHHAEFCCSTDTMYIEINFNRDTIKLREIDLGQYSWCYCRHYLEFEIGPLKNHKYVFQLIESEHSYKRDTLILDFVYKSDVSISTCE
jgi:hypothetical protein